jgi:hypothetical protein
MDRLHALDQPNLFLHVHSLPDHPRHQTTSIKKDHGLSGLTRIRQMVLSLVLTDFYAELPAHYRLLGAVRDKKSKMDLAALEDALSPSLSILLNSA